MTEIIPDDHESPDADGLRPATGIWLGILISAAVWIGIVELVLMVW